MAGTRSRGCAISGKTEVKDMDEVLNSISIILTALVTVWVVLHLAILDDDGKEREDGQEDSKTHRR